MTTEETTTKIHPWQRAGLGIAPFRYVGYELSVYQAVPGDPNCPLQPGTSCDYCGQGIMHVCRIEDADGKRFKVGCDCVKKAFADTNKRLVKTVESAVKAAKKAQQIEREEVSPGARVGLGGQLLTESFVTLESRLRSFDPERSRVTPASTTSPGSSRMVATAASSRSLERSTSA